MRKDFSIIWLVFLLIAYTGCGTAGSNTLYEKWRLKENLSTEQVLLTNGTESLSQEAKEEKYREYIENYLGEILLEAEGVADINVSISGKMDSYNVNVELLFEETIQDRDSVLQELQLSLEKFFTEGTEIEISEIKN